MDRRRNQPKDIDWLTVFLCLGLILIGWLMIYASSYAPEAPTGLFDFSNRQGVQFTWILISLATASLVMIVESKFYRAFAWPIYVLTILLLVLVLIFGQEVAGAKSWFNFGAFKFQPAEFAKIGTCLGLSAYLSQFSVSLQDNKARLYSLLIMALPMGLILWQPDAGSAMVFTSFLLLLFREGMPAELYVAGIVIGVLSVIALLFPPMHILVLLVMIGILVLIISLKVNWFKAFFGIGLLAALVYLSLYYGFSKVALVICGIALVITSIIHLQRKKTSLSYLVFLVLLISSGYTMSVNFAFYEILKPHQQDRINVWLQPEKCDPLGSMYNLSQSKLAIGSGGLTGKGFLQGRITQLNYVPEQSTDFIFCTVGEEHGFMGSFALIFLYLALLVRITMLAERQRSIFSRHYAYGVAGILYLHFFVNIGMTIGLVPIIGIPLPFISYGGSSLLAFSILMAILIKLDSVRFQSV